MGSGSTGVEATYDPMVTPTRAGLAATTVALAVTELVALGLPEGRRILSAIGDVAINVTPAPVVRFAIDVLGQGSRSVLLFTVLVVLAAAGVAAGHTAASRPRHAVAIIATIGAIGVAAGLHDVATPVLTAVIAPSAGALAGSMLLVGLTPPPDSTPASGLDSTRRVQVAHRPGSTRRGFLATAGGVAVLAAGAAFVRSWGYRDRTAPLELPEPAHALAPPAPATMLDVDGITPLLTPNDDFFRIDTAFAVPRLDAQQHRVRITGMVDNPYELSFDELLALADTEADVTLACVSNEVGGQLIGTARWLGVPLAAVLDRAGVHADADQIVGRAVDGWTSGFPVEAAYDGRPALVAIGMNGEPLPARHGFPVRLVISGLYGYVSDTKWLTEIEVTTFDAHDAYWVPRGWAQEAPIKLQSRIDVPQAGATLAAGPTAIAGVAWSDEHGLDGVEVSIDEGPWQPAQLATALASTTWRQWRLDWHAEPGDHTVRVRAIDPAGTPQTGDVAPPAPDGATGHHTIHLRVT